MSSMDIETARGIDAFVWRDAVMQDRAFRQARRHTMLVRLLRILLPVTVVLIVAGLAIVQIPALLLAKMPVSVAGLSFEDGGLKMENPRLTGFGRNEQSYELSAKAASQDILKPRIVNLEEITARIGEADGSVTSLTAANGVFDSDSEILLLKDRIVIDSASGYHMQLSNAEIDLNKGIVRTDDRVRLNMMDGSLTANAMSVENRGEVVRFEGGVSLTFTPRTKEETSNAPAESQ